MRKLHSISFLAATLLVLSGCSTIFRARVAQRALAPRGDDTAAVQKGEKVDFRSCSLEDLVAFALTNRPSVVSKVLAVHDARLALKALAADAPVISETPWTAASIAASGGHTESGGSVRLNDGVWKTEGNASAGISVQLLLYDFGRYSAKAAAQSEQVLAAELALANEGYVVFSDVTSAYFNYFEARALLAVAQTNKLQYADHLQRAEERLAAGEADRLDVLKARLDLSTANQSVVTASNLVETTGASLMQSLGVDATRGTHETAFGTTPERIDQMRRGFMPTFYPVGEAFDYARTNAPSMRVSRARFRAASHSVDAAIADLYPSISATTSLNWTDPFWAFKWGFSAAQTVFCGFSKQTAVDRAVVALQSASTDVDSAEQELSVSIEKAVATRDNARTAIISARASQRSAAENLATVREQFVVGSASRVELSEAIAASSEAAGTCITAFYDGQRAEAALFSLLGRYPAYAEGLVTDQDE